MPGKAKNYIGAKFGKLTIIDELEPIITLSGRKHRNFKYHCSNCNTDFVSSAPLYRWRKRGICNNCRIKEQQVKRHKTLLRKNGSLKSKYPKLVAVYWDYQANSISPDDITPGSHKEVHWKCPKGHHFINTVDRVAIQGHRCPYCAHQVISKKLSLLDKYPALVKTSWDFKRNKVSPDKVFAHSGKKVWWTCPNGHSYLMAIHERTKGRGCPICHSAKLDKDFNSLQAQYPYLVKKSWDFKNNKVSPDQVFAHAHQMACWICPKGHHYQMRIDVRVNGENCPYCAGKLPIIGETDLASKYHKLVKSSWDFKKNKIKPTQITFGSAKKVWWICPNGHSFKMAVYNRIKGESCPICNKEHKTSFPEQAIYFYLKHIYPDAINDDRHLGKELDIYLPSIKTAIEYDGNPWHKPSNIFKADKAKNVLCKKHRIKLIRVREQGLPEITDCIVFKRDNYLVNSTLDDAINQVLTYLNVTNEIDVNTKRDEPKILAQYKQNRLKNSLGYAYPKIKKYWDNKRNGHLTPGKISKGSHFKIYLKCPKCGHKWQASPHDILHNHRIRLNSKYSAKKELGICPICNKRKINPKIMCIETGQVFKNVKEAAKFVHLKTYTNIYYCCYNSKHYHTAGGYHWKIV